MRLWRVSQFAGLSGVGGHHADGRWHSIGSLVIYASEHPALSMLESMAHMRLSLTAIPTSLKLIAIDVAPGYSISATPNLPTGWQANERTSRAVGDAWLAGATALLLPVPSAVVPHSINYIVNAAHPQAATHLSETVAPIWIDQRFFR